MAIPTTLWPNLSLEDYLRSFYLLAAASILIASSIPQLSTRFFCYGKTSQQQPTTTRGPGNPKPSTTIICLLDYLTTFTVPHAYFSHFYLLALVSLLFWATQFLFNGSILQFLLTLGANDYPAPPNNGDSIQLALTWLCLLTQSLRRYHEQLAISKTPSSSKMLLPHYILGHAFYLATTLSIFASARPLLLHPITLIPPPFWKIAVSLPLFLLSSSLQHKIHTYLLSLPKYSLPPRTHPLFSKVLSPHYFCEILIYLGLAILSAPPRKPVNPTMFCALVFVAVNLGVSAGTTWRWYRDKFGPEAVAGRRKMIPWVY